MKVDAIVNAANTRLQMGAGVCGAIFNAAGAAQLQAACERLSPILTGDVVVTEGFSLPSKYIIHAAGPVYRDGQSGEEALLRSCYVDSLDLAKELSCDSIAFPLISSGIYGYPKDEALCVATGSIGGWLAENDMDVFLVVFDKSAFMLSKDLQGDVQSFIDENYIDTHELKRSTRLDATNLTVSECGDLFSSTAVQRLITPTGRAADRGPSHARESGVVPMFSRAEMRLDEPFSTTLLRLIDLKGRTDVDVYKRANIDRKLFSKIRSSKGYMPSKKTIVALSVALELTLSETRDLLERAGFALSRSVVFDVIIEYFIARSKYDIFEINNVLFEYDQPLLGG